jgi:pimeloyl-ACP methyl ester carboxylesterase
MKRLFGFAALAVVMFGKVAIADTLVLVQGYLGNAGSWRGTGIARVLDQNGWRDGGHMRAVPMGIVEWKTAFAGQKNTNRFFTIDLPTEAPVSSQASFLAAYLKRIQDEYGSQPVHIAGHSAGGVVARAAMVGFPDLKIKTLITIASPHHGTGMAETGLDVSSSPVGWFAPMMGAGTINRSRGLYVQLVRERPGTYLGWLNRQSHPKARYVAIIRAGGDKWVPAWSQDMNTVAALVGKVESHVVSGPHDLNIYDGLTIVNLLKKK